MPPDKKSMFSPDIISKLQTVRRATFKKYDTITLDRAALTIFSRHFLNPDCQADITLSTLPGETVPLSTIGEHIITAAPATLAKFAEDHDRTTITTHDLLYCFALDHAHDVADNHVAELKNPLYAFAHILQLSTVDRIDTVGAERTATVSLKTRWGSVIFKHVLVPVDLHVDLGVSVYHHFGVIVAVADDARYARKLMRLQNRDRYLSQWGRAAAHKKIVIDFADKRLFHKDVLGQMLNPHTVPLVKNPGDIERGKIKFKN